MKLLLFERNFKTIDDLYRWQPNCPVALSLFKESSDYFSKSVVASSNGSIRYQCISGIERVAGLGDGE